MLESLLEYSSLGLYLLQLAVAAVFIQHGVPKLKSPAAVAAGMGMSSGMVTTIGIVEVGSAVALILGIYVQLAALLLAGVMAGAIYYKTQKWNVPFSESGKMGWEFDLILLAANIAILLTGGGLLLF